MTDRNKPSKKQVALTAGYDSMLSGVVNLLEQARRTSVRAVNAIMTATYWEIGRRIVEFEQKGKQRAAYGEELLLRLSADLCTEFGRGFSRQNLQRFRYFYLLYQLEQICSTLSGKSVQTMSEISVEQIAACFPLPWSHYVCLLSVDKPEARRFYEEEALRGGWSVRQLNRQVSTLFYERTALSRNKTAILKKGGKPLPEDAVSPEEELKDPLVLEFLGLKDEYSKNELEEALIQHLESFLLELGGDFTFVGRQQRLRIGDSWYRVDLLFFHRRLRCLVVIDLKLGKFTHADAGQMHLYLNYAAEHWTHLEENPPVGLILCAQKDHTLAHYALENLPNKVLAAEYKLALPDEKALVAEIDKTRRALELRTQVKKT